MQNHCKDCVDINSQIKRFEHAVFFWWILNFKSATVFVKFLEGEMRESWDLTFFVFGRSRKCVYSWGCYNFWSVLMMKLAALMWIPLRKLDKGRRCIKKKKKIVIYRFYTNKDTIMNYTDKLLITKFILPYFSGYLRNIFDFLS